MARVNYIYRSKKDLAGITIRLIHKKELDLFYNTGILTKKAYWIKSNGKKHSLPYGKTAEVKQQKEKLVSLENFILDSFDKDYNSGKIINKEWLKYNIDLFLGKVNTSDNNLSQYLSQIIQHLIDNSHLRPNQKGSVGLSASRINDYKSLKSKIIDFEKNKRGQKIYIKDVDSNLALQFTHWLEEQNYLLGYINRIISNLKSVIGYSQSLGLEINPLAMNIKSRKVKNDFIIYLDFNEIKQIKETKLDSESLINARKWIIMGCFTGQRASDLLSLNENCIITKGERNFFQFTQVKTGKLMTIPILKQCQEVIDSGFPYPISQQKLNIHIKEIARLAKLDTPTAGKLFNKELKRNILGTYPKHKLITTHCFRRSFASNMFGKIRTPIIMKMTGHSSENVFYRYIGKTSFDYAEEFANLYDKLDI